MRTGPGAPVMLAGGDVLRVERRTADAWLAAWAHNPSAARPAQLWVLGTDGADEPCLVRTIHLGPGARADIVSRVPQGTEGLALHVARGSAAVEAGMLLAGTLPRLAARWAAAAGPRAVAAKIGAMLRARSPSAARAMRAGWRTGQARLAQRARQAFASSPSARAVRILVAEQDGLLPAGTEPDAILVRLGEGHRAEPHAHEVLAFLFRDPAVSAAFADSIAGDALDALALYDPDFLASHAQSPGLVAVRASLAAGLGSEGRAVSAAALLGRVAALRGEAAIRHIPLALTRGPAGAQGHGHKAAPERRPSGMARRPLLSVVIPTRDHPELIETAARTLVFEASCDIELVVVDHASREPRTAEALDRLRARGALVVRAEGPFNFSRLVNLGCAAASGEILAIVNDDVEAEDPDWHEPLVGLASRADVGAVGPKLLYADRRVQHAGICLGMLGLTGHAGRFRPEDDPGPAGMLLGTRRVSALTGACLVVRRAAWEAAGGLDESLAVELNDVDLCLRLDEGGLRNLWTADAVLLHKEFTSRGDPASGPLARRVLADRALFLERWSHRLVDDPWYPAALGLGDEGLAPAALPRSGLEWLLAEGERPVHANGPAHRDGNRERTGRQWRNGR